MVTGIKRAVTRGEMSEAVGGESKRLQSAAMQRTGANVCAQKRRRVEAVTVRLGRAIVIN